MAGHQVRLQGFVGVVELIDDLDVSGALEFGDRVVTDVIRPVVDVEHLLLVRGRRVLCRRRRRTSAPRPRTAPAVALDTRQFGFDPLMKLPDHVFLGHDDPADVRRRAQSPLIDLANLGILGHDQIGEFHDFAHVEFGARQGRARTDIRRAARFSPAPAAADARRARSRRGRR